jgi:hypothetical protein
MPVHWLQLPICGGIFAIYFGQSGKPIAEAGVHFRSVSDV